MDRATLTFRLGAEEAERMTGELIPLDLLPSSKDRIGITRRFPIGPIAAISPFNFPLNLAAHKLAPAIASGNPIVLKPPSKDPLVMLAVAEIIEAAGVPAGAVSILPMTRELGDRMVADERFKLLTFTGSPSVGWRMKERAGKKKVVLELGGNAGVIVDRTADLDWAVRRILVGGVHLCRPGLHQRPARVHPRGRLGRRSWRSSPRASAASSWATRSTRRPTSARWSTSTPAARTQRWVDEAVALGGTVVVGRQGRRHVLPADDPHRRPDDGPGLLQRGVRAARRGGPVRRPRRGHREVNDSMFGLQTGVFTNDLAGAWRAFAELEVGGVIINDVPTYRIDHMPYGGVKDSGLGREGLRWAIEDMTEIRIMVLAQPA